MCIKIPLCLKCGVPHIPSEIANRVREGDVVDVEIIYPSGVAGNVLRWGTGALNIDGCRIETAENLNGGAYSGGNKKPEDASSFFTGTDAGKYEQPSGRWPANLCHDGSPEVLAGFPETTTSKRQLHHDIGRTHQSVYGEPAGAQYTSGNTHGDSGSAARFFYHAKANKKDRISRTIETVTIEWISESGPSQVALRVDTEPSPQKAIVVSGSTENNEWSTFLSGSNITALCQMASNCTIETKTNSTTSSPTWNWLTRLLTSAFIQAANCEGENGSSHVGNAEKSDPSLIITLGETVFLPGASRALSGTQLKISVNAKQHGHPTVKPVALLSWLIRMICPPGGTILDPFSGTGTTGEAALLEGCNAILVERESEYQADIKYRMKRLVFDAPRPAKKPRIKSQPNKPIIVPPDADLFSAGHA